MTVGRTGNRAHAAREVSFVVQTLLLALGVGGARRAHQRAVRSSDPTAARHEGGDHEPDRGQEYADIGVHVPMVPRAPRAVENVHDARVTLAGALIALPVALSLHALLALQAPAAPPATVADAQTILWFRSADTATIDARALLDAVAVYTRDLGLEVRAAPEATPVPADASAATAATATLRAQGARLGFWCELRAGADVAVLTVVAPDGHLELHLVERTGAQEAELYRAIGLKLRSVLTGTATPEPAPRRAAPPAPSPTASPPAGGSPSTSASAPRPRRPRHRHGVLSHRSAIACRCRSTPRRPACARDRRGAADRPAPGVALGTALAPRIEEQVGTDTLSIFDWPITAGARIVRRRPGVTFGGGLFAALHLRWASATGADAGMAQSATSFTAGAGAGAERWPASG